MPKDSNEGGPPAGHIWFSASFKEGRDPTTKILKKKLIQEFYEGYLLFFNQENNDVREITGYVWTKENSTRTVDVYIDDVAGGATDPPPPKTGPPPSMP